MEASFERTNPNDETLLLRQSINFYFIKVKELLLIIGSASYKAWPNRRSLAKSWF